MTKRGWQRKNRLERGRQQAAQIQPQPRSDPPPPSGKHWWSQTWVKISAFVTGIITTLTLIGFYIDVPPSITVDPSNAREPKNPFSVPFKIENHGWITAQDVSYACVVTEGQFQQGTAVLGNPMVKFSLIERSLGHGQPVTMYCPIDLPGKPISRIQMEVLVCYKIPFYFHRYIETHWFREARDSSGMFYFDYSPPPESTKLPDFPTGGPC